MPDAFEPDKFEQLDTVPYDPDEIGHHAHSDPDSQDGDPLFEYNKCNEVSFLDVKVHSKLNKYKPILLNMPKKKDSQKEKAQDNKSPSKLYEQITDMFEQSMAKLVQIPLEFTGNDEKKGF